MTKKDYIKIASVLKDYRVYVESNDGCERMKTNFKELEYRFLVMLKDDNERFDAEKFSDYIYSD